jgi:HTH-type transcriptional regulator/antitoxin HigA
LEGIRDAPEGYGECGTGMACLGKHGVCTSHERGISAARRFLDALIDEAGEEETHPLASLMEVVGVLIERYEEEYVPELTEE